MSGYLKVRQTGPSGHQIDYDMPVHAPVATVLTGWTLQGGAKKVTVECVNGKTWSFERAPE